MATRALIAEERIGLIVAVAAHAALVALILLGGETIREFLIIMLIGLVSGTYSSIFVASQLLISWEHGELPLISRRQRAEMAEAV